MRASQDLGQIPLPCIFYSRLKNFATAQVLQGPEVVPQVLDRLDVVLLLCCKDGVESLQLDRKKQRIAIEANSSAIVHMYTRLSTRFQYIMQNCIWSCMPVADSSQLEYSNCK